MIERAFMLAMIVGAMFVIATVAQHYHPLALAAQALHATNCAPDWSAQACAAR